MVCIGTNEANGISIAGQFVIAPGLDGIEIEITNAQSFRDVAQFLAEPQSRCTQQRANAWPAFVQFCGAVLVGSHRSAHLNFDFIATSAPPSSTKPDRQVSVPLDTG